MFVRCSNCQTQFSLDDRQVGAEGTAVRCAVCRYVFRVEPPAGAEFVRWRVQTVEGEAFEAEDLATLRVWIREGRLHPDDTISRTGKHWIRLGDMPEFSDAFAGFPDLPAVLSFTPEPESYGDVSVVGPPPSFAGSDLPQAAEVEEETVAGRVSEPSQRLDLAGLLADPDPQSDPDETSVRGVSTEEPTRVEAVPGVPRTSMFDEDSASMVLDDLVAPRSSDREPGQHTAARRRPKHRTAKVQIVGEADEIDADKSGVVRLLDMVDEDEAVEGAVQDEVKEIGEVHSAPLGLDAEDAVSRNSGPRKVVGSGSMLGAVTAHVKPITTPTELPVVEASPRLPTVEDSPGPSHIQEPPTKRTMWPLFAGLGLLCGAAVIFGIPQIRAKVMSVAGVVAGQETETPAEVAAGDEALRLGSRRRLVAARKAVDDKLSQGGTLAPGPRTALALVGAELAAAEAVSLRLEASLSGAGSDAANRADELTDAATSAFAGLDVQAADAARVARVRARLRMAQGRPEDEVLPLVPAAEAELHAMAVSAPLWQGQGSQMRVPSGVIGALAGLSQPSIEARVVLALAYARGGDEVAAAAVRQELREQAAQDPAVIALLGSFGTATPPTAPDQAADSGAEESRSDGDSASPGTDAPDDARDDAPNDDEPLEVADDSAGGGPDAKPSGRDPKKADGGGKGMSTDKAIEVGCSKVENGDISAGLKLLLRAFDRRPNDLDVLVCLGMAHRKKGTHGTALRYYDRALARSPRFLPALLGAARAASKGKSTDRAAGYYRRILAISPGNAEAKSYLAKTKAAADPTPSKPPGEKKGENSGDNKGDSPGPSDKPRKPAPPTAPTTPEPTTPAPAN